MASVKLAVAELTNEEKVQLATNIDSKMTGNASRYGGYLGKGMLSPSPY